MMDIQAGKRYFGAEDTPCLVTAADADTVYWYDLFGLGDQETPRAEFEAWAAQSERRNYVHKNGERRIKLMRTDPTKERGEGVCWVTVESQYDRQWSPVAEWNTWRAEAA